MYFKQHTSVHCSTTLDYNNTTINITNTYNSWRHANSVGRQSSWTQMPVLPVPSRRFRGIDSSHELTPRINLYINCMLYVYTRSLAFPLVTFWRPIQLSLNTFMVLFSDVRNPTLQIVLGINFPISFCIVVSIFQHPTTRSCHQSHTTP
jgi:hypothetical protein